MRTAASLAAALVALSGSIARAAPPVEAKPAPKGAAAAPKKEDGGRCRHPDCALFWPSLLGFVAPGVPELVDHRRASPYLAIAGLGLAGTFASAARIDAELLAAHPELRNDHDGESKALTREMDLTNLLLNHPDFLVLSEMFQTPGFLSAYDTYRARARSMGLDNQLPRVSEILWAPLEVQHLVEPEVLAPLAVALGLTAWDLTHPSPGPRAARPFQAYRPQDAGTTLALAYAAGTGEEAFFRGFLLSYLADRWGWNRWLANGAQALLFSAAHGDFNPVDFTVRAALGAYLGWVAQSHDEDIRRGVLIHACWDVIAFTAFYATVSPSQRQGMITLPIVVL